MFRRSLRSHSNRSANPIEALEQRALLSAAGDLDTTFSGDGRLSVPDVSNYLRSLTSSAIQSDGKLVVAGGAGLYRDGEGDAMVARYNTDGSPDTTFGGKPDGRVVVAMPGSQSAQAMVIVPGGKILVAAYNTNTGAVPAQTLLLRFNTNGTLDTTFGGGDGIQELVLPGPRQASPADMKLSTVGGTSKIVLSLITQTDFVAARLNLDGSPDSSFSGDGFAFVDAGFNDSPDAILAASDGSLFIGGSRSPIETTNPSFESALLKLTPSGSPDTNFGNGGFLFGTLNAPNFSGSSGTELAFSSDGKVLFGGGSNNNLVIAKLSPTNGAFDNSFSGDGRLFVPQPSSGVQSIAVQSDGKLVVGTSGSAGSTRADANMYIFRFQANGDTDPTWNGGNPAIVDFYRGWDTVYDLSLQSDGKVIAVGSMESGSDDSWQNVAIARLTTSGQLDTSFSGDGKFGQDFADVRRTVSAVVVQSDGKTVVAGTLRQFNPASPGGISDDFFITRYNVNGTVDTGFGTGGSVVRDVFTGQFDVLSNILIQPDGKILALGSTAGFGRDADVALMRFNANGTSDTTFSGDGRLSLGLGGDDRGVDIALRSDGDVLITATSTAAGHANVLVRFNCDGTFDSGLDGDGSLYHTFGTQIAVLSDNRVIIANQERDPAPGTEELPVVVRRLNTNGSVDTSYGVGGIAKIGFGGSEELGVVDLTLVGGKALVLADLDSDAAGSVPFVSLIRLNTNGSPDASFGGGDGKAFYDTRGEAESDHPRAFAVDGQGRIVVVTSAERRLPEGSTFAFEQDFSMLRITASGDRDASFGDNGRVWTDFNQPVDPDEQSVERSVDVAIGPDGRIVQVGRLETLPGYGVARYLSDANVTPPPLPGVEIVNGVMKVTGTDGGDNIELEDLGPTANQYVVRINGNSGTFARNLFSRVEVNGGNGDDRLFAVPHTGASYTDLPMTLNGGVGNDELHGGSGNDTLLGLDGNDRLFGHDGNDKIDGGIGTDLQDGGAGTDTVDYSFRNSPVRVDLEGDADDGPSGENDTVAANVENIIGGKANDTLIGNNGVNIIRGGAGNDYIRGGGGNDSLYGDAGADRLFGDDGNDYLDARDGVVDLQFDGGAGFDKLRKDSNDPAGTSIEQLV
jgi:uncharacterized delta-60 repeat protein